MKKKWDNSVRASALQTTLALALISISTILLASGFTPPSAGREPGQGNPQPAKSRHLDANGALVFAKLSPSLTRAPQPRQLTLADRVAYQRAIEEVYWRHRIWPKERRDPKPSLDAVMSQAQLEKKVVDYLRNSQVLENYWQRTLTAEQLQAEMERMGQHTKQPEVLRELFEALGNDPFVIAECLARPALSERLVTNFYAYDQRFHRELRQRAEAALLAHPTVEQMKQTLPAAASRSDAGPASGKYSEIELLRSDSARDEGNSGAETSLKMNSREWDENMQKLATMFGGVKNSSVRNAGAPTAPTPTPTPTPAPTLTPTPTSTPTPTPTPTSTPTPTPTSTPTPTPTPTPTSTPTPTPTSTPRPTPTPTPTCGRTNTDFNHNGKPDYVLYKGGTRQTAVWYMNNNVFFGGAYGPTLPAGWNVIDVADFNADGNPDYALFNASTRQSAIWYLSGVTFIGGHLGPTLPSGWRLVATGDFLNNCTPDYVLYNASTRQTAVWYMNDNVFLFGLYGPTLPAGWSLAGVADFDGDGLRDYLLFNASTRQSAIWYLSGITFVGGLYGPTIASGYQLTGTADFNGDGKPDYLLYNPSTRQTAIWYLNNNIFIRGAYGPTLPTGWNLVAP
jgi:FG-GAP-like repeat